MYALVASIVALYREHREMRKKRKLCQRLGHDYSHWRCMTCGRLEPAQDMPGPRQS